MFKYKYQKLLDYQKMLEEKAKEELSSYVRMLGIAEKQLDRLAGVKYSYEKRLSEKQKNGESVNVLILYSEYIHRLENELYLQQQEVEKIKSKITTIKEKLLRLNKKRKILEKLQERAKANFVREQEAEELKKLSEFAVHQFNKKNGNKL